MAHEWQRKVLTTDDQEQWRSLVEAMPHRDIFFTPEYVIPFEGLSGGTVRLFFFGNEANYIVYPFFRRQIAIERHGWYHGGPSRLCARHEQSRVCVRRPSQQQEFRLWQESLKRNPTPFCQRINEGSWMLMVGTSASAETSPSGCPSASRCFAYCATIDSSGRRRAPLQPRGPDLKWTASKPLSGGIRSSIRLAMALS